MTLITAEIVTEMRECFCTTCSRSTGCPILLEAQDGMRPEAWVHPPRRAIVLTCRRFKSSDRQPKDEAPAPQLDLFGAEPQPYRLVPISTTWDHFDAAAFGRKDRGR